MIDYYYYTNNYKGTAIGTIELFDSLKRTAVSIINYYVCCEYDDGDVADCICTLCDFLYKHSDTEGIRSEKADTVSVTYDSGYMKNEIASILRLNLPPRLLYRGLD